MPWRLVVFYREVGECPIKKSTEYSTPLPFAEVTFLKTPANGKALMCEGKTLWEKWG
jgi:hypothetical protein